jgi:glycosyltransferase involved in cell wall biosynthesis
MSPLTISIIIPTFNEQRIIEEFLLHLIKITHFSSKFPIKTEIIVVDGGSSDNTFNIAKKYADITLKGPPGKSMQINKGAEHASGDVLLFLHADTILAHTALLEIYKEMNNPNVIGGGFFKNWEWSPGVKLSWVMQKWNILLQGMGKLLVLTYRVFPADNGIFVRKTIFRDLKGFRRMWMCEGFDFTYRLRDLAIHMDTREFNIFRRQTYRKRIKCLRCNIKSSTRRFEQFGFFRVWAWWTGIFFCWRLGWSQEKLKKKFLTSLKKVKSF